MCQPWTFLQHISNLKEKAKKKGSVCVWGGGGGGEEITDLFANDKAKLTGCLKQHHNSLTRNCAKSTTMDIFDTLCKIIHTAFKSTGSDQPPSLSKGMADVNQRTKPY